MINPLNEISSVYLEEVLKPQLGNKTEKPQSPGGKVKKGETTEEASAKRVRQAVYDIRYRARREDVPLEQAFNQYSGKSGMTGPEKTAVKEKLGLGAGPAQSNEEYLPEEERDRKYKVRVKDKTSGKSYVRYATREKINSLRANPNISSVEMTGYGDPYEGERKRGKQTARATAGKGLDPVGQEDKDIDNDGDHDKTDKYLLNRRKKIGKAIKTRKEEVEVDEKYQGLYQSPQPTSTRVLSKDKKARMSPGRRALERSDELMTTEPGSPRQKKQTKVARQIQRNYQSARNEEIEVPSGDIKKLVKKAVKRVDANVDGSVNKSDPSDKTMGVFVPSPDGKKKIYGTRMKEGFSNWKEDLREVMDKVDYDVKIKEKKVKNKIKINPNLKEAIEDLGGEILEFSEDHKEIATGEKKDDEGYMARTELDKIEKAVEELRSVIKSPQMQLPAWVQSKITKAVDYLDTAANYLQSDEESMDEDLEFIFSELLDEGYIEDEIEDAIVESLVEARVTFGHDTETPRQRMMKQVKGRLRYLGRKAGEKLSSVKKAATHQSAKAQVAAYNKGREIAQTAGDTVRKKKKSLKNRIKGIAQKVVNRMSEEYELQEKSLSISQQQAAGAALAAKRGETDPSELKGASIQMYKSMTEKELRDFAKTKHKGLPKKKEVEEAVSQMPGRQTNPPSGTTAKQDDIQKQQMLANKKKMMQKQQMLQRQQFQLQKQGKLPLNYGEEYEVDEATRYAKETGKSFKSGKERVEGGSMKDDKAFQSVSKMMRGMQGKPAGQKPKVKGKKPPAAGEFGGPKSPAQKVAARRAAAKRAQDNMSSRFD